MKKLFLMIIIILLCISSFYLLSNFFDPFNIGSSNTQDDEEALSSIVVYYKSYDNVAIPITYEASNANIDSIISYLTNEELAESNGLKTPLTKDEIISAEKIGNAVYLKLKESFNESQSKEEEIAKVNCILYSLTQYEEISSINLSLEDESITHLKYETSLNNNIYRKNINEVNLEKDEASKYTMVFPKNSAVSYLYIPYTFYFKEESLTLEEIIKAHHDFSFDKSFSHISLNEECTLISCEVNEEIVYINISEAFLAIDSNEFNKYKTSLMFTIKENNANIEKIEFIINNKEGNNGIIQTVLIENYINKAKENIIE